MADRPIIFSAPMVRALLDGRKTQTRRITKRQDSIHVDGKGGWLYPGFLPYDPGDRLYVREAFKIGNDLAPDLDLPPMWIYRATSGDPSGPWRSPIHMPRSASRLTLTVTDVRVQRLQEIGEADAVAEGIEPYAGLDPDCHGFINYQTKSEDGYWLSATDSFRTLWANLHGPDAWGANPWVVALTFTVQHGNIDQMEAGHG